MQPDLDRMRGVILDLMAEQMCPDAMLRVLVRDALETEYREQDLFRRKLDELAFSCLPDMSEAKH